MARILIVRLGAFGDIIHTLPLAYDLSQNGHIVDWVCDHPWQVVLEDNPAINDCYVIPRKRWKNKITWLNGEVLSGLWQLRRQLKRNNYDVVIDAQGRSKSALAALLSGAKRRISHDSSMAREGAALISHIQVPGQAEHIVDNLRSLSLPVKNMRWSSSWQFPLPNWSAETCVGSRCLCC